MAEVAPAPAAATPVKAPRKKASKPSKKSGPGAGELILQAVAASKGRNGISYVAVKKYMAAQGYDVKQNSAHIKRAVRKLLAGGSLVQLKGSGATGSFKAAKPAEKPKKPAAAAKKSAVKPKKPVAAKRPAAAKKSAVVAKKPKAVKTTPKKAKKPAVAKKTSVKKITKSPKKKMAKKAASPKKTVKKVVKAKPAKKAVAAKKPAKRSAAKKPAKK